MKIDWSQIQTVLLDMDGTILDLHFDNHFWLTHLPNVYAQENQISKRQAWEFLEPLLTKHQATLNWYCVNFWSEQLNLDIMQHKNDVAHKIGYRPAAEKFLQHCQQHVNDFRLVTNGHREVLDLKIERTKLDQYFNQMICSHELGWPKEKIQYWQQLHEMSPYDPATTLFVDDSEAVLDSAKEYGIAYVFSIAQPDSTKQREIPSKHPMIESFENHLD
jgi:putative hydrolase of the HAD superfamily